VFTVSWPCCGTDGYEGQDGSRRIESRVNRIRNESKAARQNAEAELRQEKAQVDYGHAKRQSLRAAD
jgi:hypothetical protein